MPVVSLAEVLVTPSFTGTQRAISRHLGPAAEQAGRRAGSAMGVSMAEGLASETAGLEAEVSRLGKSVASAQDKVAASRTRSEAAAAAEERALGAVRVAELKLAETRESARATASQIAAAEERVSAARGRAAISTSARTKAEQDLARATGDLTSAQHLSSRASEDLEAHMRRVSAESANTERSFGRLGNILNRSFRGRPLSEIARGIREDASQIDFDLHNMSQRVSQEGTRGGRAFTQAFVGVVGGLSAVTPAAGAAGAALVGASGSVITLAASMKDLVGVAALAPAAMITVGAGAGVLKAAFFGVGDALKTATEASGQAAGSAAVDAAALQDAARGVARAEQSAAESRAAAATRISDAQQKAADAREAAAQRVVDAEQQAAESQVASNRRIEDAKRNLQSVTEQAAAQQAAAVNRVADAERDVERANRRVTESQQALNDARAEAAQRVRDLSRSLESAGLSERAAAIRLEEARTAFEKGAASGKTPNLEYRKLKLDLDQAAFGLEEAKNRTKELRAEQSDAAKAGVDGNKQVQAAEQGLADARQSATDAIAARQDAVDAVAKTERDGAASIIAAQRDVADATREAAADRADSARMVAEARTNAARVEVDSARDVADAVADGAKSQVDAAEAVADAHRALERVQLQQAAAAAKAGQKAADAMAKLTPNARTAVGALLGVYEQLGNIRRIAQENFFAGFTGPLQGLAATVLPQLATGVGLIATAFGGGAQQLMTSLTTALGGGVLDGLLSGVADSITKLIPAIDPFVQAFVTLGTVGMDYMPQLATAISDMAAQFNTFIQDAAASGELKGWIDAGLQGFRDIASIIGSVSGIFGALADAARAGGIDTTLGSVAANLDRIEAIMQGPVFQQTMATIFEGAAAGARGLSDALGPVGEAFRTGAPALAEFLRLSGEIAGTFLGGIFTALSDPGFGAGLTTFLEAVQRGVGALVPLLPGLTSAFGQVLTAMAPIVEQLGPSLVEVFTFFGEAIAGVLTFLSPFLTAIAGSPLILGLLIGAFAATAAASALLTAAGNVQRIAMAGWAVASGIVRGALFLLKLEWIKTAAAAVISGAQTAAVWLMYRLDAAKSAAAFLVSKAQIAAGWVAMSAAAVASGIRTAAVWTGTIIAQAATGAAAFAVQVARVVGGWVLMGVQSLLQAARMAAAWLIAMGPVGWVIAAVIGLVALIIANWDTISAVTARVWSAIVGWVTGAWNNIKTAVYNALVWVGTFILGAMAGIKSQWSAAWNWVKTVLSNAWAGIKGAVYNALAWVGNIVLTGLNNIKTNWSNAWNWVKTKVATIWDGIKLVVSNAWSGLKGTLNLLIGFVRDKISGAFEKARDGIGTAWDAIKAKVKTPIRAVVGFINEGLIDKFNEIPGVEIPPLKLPKGFRTGGYTGDIDPRKAAGVVHGREFVFTAAQTAALGKENLAAMAHAAVRGNVGAAAHVHGHGCNHGAAASAGEGNIGGFFEGNAAAIRRHGAYYMDVAAGMGNWNFGGAAKLWDGAAGVKVAVGRGQLQGRVTPLERGGGILGYTTGNNIDMSPSWMAQLAPKQRLTVAAHEVGHALGLPHNSLSSIMQPNLANMAATPTPVDIRNLQRLYPGGSGKAGDGEVTSPFDGLIDAMVGKIKEAFPSGGMFVDMAGGLAKTGLGQVVQWVSDIKEGLKNIAGDVVDSIKGFFGGGAATEERTLFRDQGGILPPGVSRVLNDTGGNEYVLNRQQWRDMHHLATRTEQVVPDVRVFVGNEQLDARIEVVANRTISKEGAAQRYRRVGV